MHHSPLLLLFHAACDCVEVSSISTACDKQSGVCQCREGATGEKCDQCLSDTTGLLPYCELCDECSSVWDEPIENLETSATSYISIASSINTTNITSSELLQPLLDLLADIELYLNSSAISSLQNSTIDLFFELCEQLSLLEELLDRAMFVQIQSNNTLAIVTGLNIDLTEIKTTLKFLESLFANISEKAAQLKPVDFAMYVTIIEMAEERSNMSDELVQTVLLSHISESEQTLQDFQSKESQFLLIAKSVFDLISMLNQAIEQYQLLVDEASRSLCGNPLGNKCDGGGMCGGVECGMCGGEGGCDGSVNQIQQAGNISEEALQRANNLYQSLLNTTNHLSLARNQSELALNNSIEANLTAQLARILAMELFSDTEELIAIVSTALDNNLGLLGLDLLGMIEAETLLLNISQSPEEVRLKLEKHVNCGGYECL